MHGEIDKGETETKEEINSRHITGLKEYENKKMERQWITQKLESKWMIHTEELRGLLMKDTHKRAHRK